MKELKLETRVEVYAVGELDNIYRQLYEAAFEASKKAYAPYSKFHVGAAVLLENGEILSGNNQENAAYPSGLRFPDYFRKVSGKRSLSVWALRGADHLILCGSTLSGCGSSDFGDRGYEGWGTCGSYHALWCLPASDVGNRATL